MPPEKSAAGPAALVLTATVARRYYFDGASKSDIAAELDLSRFKVARLLDQARASGLVRIELDYRGEINLDLSVRLSTALGLRHCVVIDSPEDDEALLRANLGRAGAGLLAEILDADDVLGLAWARTLMEMRRALTRLVPCAVVQMTGALSRPDVDESSIELVRDVARISGGPASFFYAPMILPDAATARALRTQPEIARAISRFPDLTKAVVGLGAWQEGQSTVADAVSHDERRELHDQGVRAETSGILLDADGRSMTAPLTERIIGIDAAQLQAVPEVIAIVYGTSKAGAVRAAVRGGIVTSLVTHASMASELLDRE
ncbi:MAG: transcriptional regulator [Actinomycetota bacterium]|nr:transcriptional regulator [Actinomycetota bacterium]